MAGKKLQGQVAIVTGAGRGIGAAAARRLAAAGAMVVLAARSAEEIEAVAAELRQAKRQAIAVAGDITDPDVVEEVVESALDQFNRIDILVNNAGVIWPLEEVAEVDAEEWTYNIFTNLIAPMYMVRSVLPLMIDQGYGRIVNVSSHGAQIPIAGASAYSAAKAGLDMLTRVLALEVAGRGVTVNAFYPGDVDTAMQEDIRSVDTTDTRLDTSYFHDIHARGELVAPSVAADFIYWLAGPWSKTHNGVIFDAADAAWVAQVARDLA